MKGSLAAYLGKDYLFSLGQYKLLGAFSNIGDAMKLMTAASQLGHQEATWLLSLIAKAEQPRQQEGYRTVRASKRSLFIDDPSPKALGYLAYFTDDTAEKLKYTRLAVAANDAIGQYVFSDMTTHIPNKSLKAESRLKSAQQGFILAIRELINYYTDVVDNPTEMKKWMLRSAHLGDPYHTYLVSRSYRKGEYGFEKDYLKAAKWFARSMMNGGVSGDKELRKFLGKESVNWKCPIYDRFSIDVVCTIGKEFDGYLEIFPEITNRKDAKILSWITAIYGRIMSSIRKSTLFTIHAFRRVLGRDVATLIAKAVYATKSDPFKWHRE